MIRRAATYEIKVYKTRTKGVGIKNNRMFIEDEGNLCAHTKYSRKKKEVPTMNSFVTFCAEIYRDDTKIPR